MQLINFQLKGFFSHLLSYYRLKQKMKINNSQTQLKMDRILKSKEIISVPELSPGFQQKYYEPNQDKFWLQVLNISHEFGVWDPPRLSKFTSEMIPHGGVIIFNDCYEPVACAAICLKKKFKPLAVLMNVIVLTSYRGLGISKVMVTSLLAKSQINKILGVTLLTDDFRLPAINLYLKLGFKPDYLWSLDAHDRWETVFAELGDKKH